MIGKAGGDGGVRRFLFFFLVSMARTAIMESSQTKKSWIYCISAILKNFKTRRKTFSQKKKKLEEKLYGGLPSLEHKLK